MPKKILQMMWKELMFTIRLLYLICWLIKTKNLELPKPVGISKISNNDIALAKENGKIIRHLAISVCKDEKFVRSLHRHF